jgi:hypothetical protein
MQPDTAAESVGHTSPQPLDTATESAATATESAATATESAAAGTVDAFVDPFVQSRACCWGCGKRQEQVSRKLQRCSKCGNARYCSAECQRHGWTRQHKVKCGAKDAEGQVYVFDIERLREVPCNEHSVWEDESFFLEVFVPRLLANTDTRDGFKVVNLVTKWWSTNPDLLAVTSTFMSADFKPTTEAVCKHSIPRSLGDDGRRTAFVFLIRGIRAELKQHGYEVISVMVPTLSWREAVEKSLSVDGSIMVSIDQAQVMDGMMGSLLGGTSWAK